MRKYVKSNDGYALVIALLVITVVTVLGLGILTTTSSSKKLSEEESKDQTAYYIAEAGLNQKKEELKEIPNLYNEYIKNKDIKNMKEADIIKDFLKEIKNKPILNKETIYREDIFKRKNAEAKVIVTIPSETELKFTITSTGIIKSNDSSNEKKRTVQSVDSYKLAITEKPAEEEFGTSKYVVHALRDFKFVNGTIKGRLGFKQSSQGRSNTFPYKGWGSYYGTKDNPYNRNTALEDGIANGDLVFNDSELPKIPKFPKEKFISLDTITQPPNVTNIQQGLPIKRPIPSGNYRVTIAELTQSTILNIDTNNVTLLIADANFNNTKLTFIGKGNLKIITNNFKTSGGDPALIDFDKNNTEIYSTNFNVDGGWGNKNGSIKTNGSLKIFNTNQVIFSGDAKLHSTEDITIYSKGSFSQVGSAGIASAKNLEVYSEKILINAGEGLIMNISENINFYAYKEVGLKTTFKMNSKNTNLYYVGETKPEFTGGFNNNINFDFLNSSIKISNGFNITGNIILRGEKPNNLQKVEIIGGLNLNTPSYFFAPEFDLELTGTPNIEGSIIGNNINVDNANITYKQPPPNNGGSTGGATGGGSIDSSLTPNSDSGSIEVNNP